MNVRWWFRRSAPYLAQTAVLAVLLPVVLELWRLDFHVRFNYYGDSLWFAVLAKSVSQNGWAYFVPQLSAPYGLSAAAFPTIMHVDWLAMKALALFIKDPAVVFNVFWLLTIFATAWTGLLALRLLGTPTWLAVLGGLLYACIPFTWMRSTGHLSLVFYSVPLLCVFAVYLIRGPVAPWTDPTYRRVGLAGALLQGFGYVYFSWFAMLLFAVAGVLGYARRRQRDVLVWAAIGFVTVGAAAVLNLVPSAYSWHKHGVPHIGYKVPVEAELYGLKIRRMLVPHPRNPIPPLSAWASRDAQARFPNENENQSVRLGIFGALGFLLLIWVSVTSPTRRANGTYDTVGAVAALNLIALLVVTVGGFGAIINTLTVPDIRAYNRFSVFLAFFATAGFSLWVGRLWGATRRVFRPWLALAVLAIGGLSLYDQVMDARWIAAGYERDKAVAEEVGAVLAGMEARFPERTRVFQLPITDFPVDAGRVRMLSYDHARPYLQSDHFDWSWPSFSRRHLGWTRFIATVHGEALVRALATAGFGAVWVDRFGYRDRGRAVTRDVVSGGAVEVLRGTSRRYAVYDIRGVAPGTGPRPGVGGVRPSLRQTP